MPLNECAWLKDKSSWLRKAVLDVVYPGALESRRTCLPILQEFSSIRIGKGEGLLSDVYQISLDWSVRGGRDENLPRSLVLKLLNFDRLAGVIGKDGVIEEKTLEFLVEAHNRECAFYAAVMRMEGGLPGDVPIPRCYSFQRLSGIRDAGPGILLLQDFSNTAANVAVVDGISLDQAISYAKGLARFHAFCYQHPELLKGFPCLEVADEHFYRGWEERTKEFLLDAHKNFPEIFGEREMELLATAFAQVPAQTLLMGTHAEMGISPVLANSDTWTGNLLFVKERGWKEGTSPAGDLAAIIDWQAVHVGSPTTDLARLIWSSCQPEDRRRETESILRAYYEELETRRSEAAQEFPFQLLRKAYDRLSVWAGIGAVAYTVLNFLHVKPIAEDDPLREEKIQRALDRAKAAMEDVLLLLPRVPAYEHLATAENAA